MRYWVHADTFDGGDMKAKALKPLEEASEAREAVQVYERERDGINEAQARYSAVYECCDVLQATCNLLDALGVSQEELDATMRDVHESNEERGRYA